MDCDKKPPDERPQANDDNGMHVTRCGECGARATAKSRSAQVDGSADDPADKEESTRDKSGVCGGLLSVLVDVGD